MDEKVIKTLITVAFAIVLPLIGLSLFAAFVMVKDKLSLARSAQLPLLR